ncbi:MAG: hypothetical protein WC146_03310 [Patescibacteria group bacterium]|jgi:hypothetical protein
MKKSLIGPIVAAIVIVLVAASFVYVYIQLNRMEKKMLETQTTIIEDSGKLTAIVNFLNSNSNAQTSQE